MSYTGTIPDTAGRPMDWLATAPCKDAGDAMFPGSLSADIAYAKSFCQRCSAIELCLRWALDTGEEWGVWGGLSEAERNKMRRSAVRPIDIDEYAGTTPPRSAPVQTLEEAWAQYTQPDGEHILWTGPKVVHHGGDYVTSNRLSFRLDRGHWPEGDVKRACKTAGCVRPAHLADQRERAEEADLAVGVR